MTCTSSGSSSTSKPFGIDTFPKSCLAKILVSGKMRDASLLLMSLLLLNLCLATANRPYVLFDTGAPPDAFGIDGEDLLRTQSVGVRFVSNAEATLHSIDVWLMSNEPTVNTSVTISFMACRNGTSATPDGDMVERWALSVPPVGWAPRRFTLTSVVKPDVPVGSCWWVLGESAAVPEHDALWCLSDATAFGATTDETGKWQPGAASSSVAVTVSGVGASAPLVRQHKDIARPVG
jgi:hypothetical protein